ncbi:MAG: hypothetical protein AB8G99_25470 [Planctomycetaceae bacterium]
MSPKKTAVLQIVIALLFAGSMIAAKAVFGEDSIDEHFIIALWWIPFSLLSAGGCGCRFLSTAKQES